MEQNSPHSSGREQGIPSETLKTFEQQMLAELDQPYTNPSILISKPVNEWLDIAKDLPIPKMLFSELWYEGEICVFFADTNAGKSILGVQIGNSIATGEPIPGFKLGAVKQPVVYFDFELNEKQFQYRYSADYEENYYFAPELIRSVIDCEAPLMDGADFEAALKESITYEVLRHNAKVLIIDNLTYLNSENEKAKEASALMKYLKRLKTRLGLSILVLAHTPKREAGTPLTANSCQGSKMLGNFSDSSFAISKSMRGKDIRYLKQIKVRFGGMTYDENKVIICNISNPHNFTQFNFMEYGNEMLHIKPQTNNERTELETAVMDLHAEGISLRQIAKQLSISHMVAKRIIDRRNKT